VYKQADLQLQPNDENLSIETAQFTLLVCNWLTQCNLIFFKVIDLLKNSICYIEFSTTGITNQSIITTPNSQSQSAILKWPFLIGYTTVKLCVVILLIQLNSSTTYLDLELLTF
jgi:hypothetical protein